ncbi:MAG: hypothetical protein RBT57_07225 [Paludibacter sp.]|nr:hypothetical protein [Paludibacter sp.]
MKTYMSPTVEHIVIDTTISLVLYSNPPEGPGEDWMVNSVSMPEVNTQSFSMDSLNS